MMGSPGIVAGKSSVSQKKMDTATEKDGSRIRGGKDFPTTSFYTCMMLFEPQSTHRMAQRWTKHRTVRKSHPWKQHKGGEQLT